MEEFALRRACAPRDDFGAAGGFRLVKLTNQRGQHVRVLQVIVVPGTVEIGRHRRVEHHAELLPVGLGELETRDLGNSVGLVGRLQRSGEQTILGHRLRCELRINARTAEEEQALHPVFVGAVDRVGRDGEILKQELRRISVVRVDTADLGCGDDGHVGFFRGVKCLHRDLRRQVEFAARAEQERRARLAREAAHERATDHAVVTCDEDFHANGAEDGAGSAAICASRLASSRSAAVMIFTSSLNFTFGSQPSWRLAFAGSPISNSTSAGRS